MFESKRSCEFCKIDKEIKKFDRRNGGVLKITIGRCLITLIVFFCKVYLIFGLSRLMTLSEAIKGYEKS